MWGVWGVGVSGLGLGFEVWVLGFGVWVLGSGVWVLGLRVSRVSCLGGPALRAGSNIHFQAPDLYWTSPDSATNQGK